MKIKYQVLNVKCQGCAKTLKSALKDEFGEIEVDLELNPRVITVDMNSSQESKLRLELKKIGYPISDESLTKIEKVTTTAKSFVSCAIGRI